MRHGGRCHDVQRSSRPHVGDGIHALSRYDPRDVSEAVVELIKSKDLADSLTARAYDLVTCRYDWKAIALEMRAALVGFLGQDPLVANWSRISPHPRH